MNESSFIELINENLNNIKTSIYWLDISGRIIYVNEYACIMQGFEKFELLEMHVWEIDPNLEMTDWSYYLNSVKKSPQKIKRMHKNKEAEEYTVEITSTYHAVEDKEIIICYVHNLVEEKEIINLENNYIWDKKKKTLFHHKKELKLTKNEIKLLSNFCINSNEIITSEEIYYQIYNDYEYNSNKVRMLLKRLRNKTYQNMIINIYGLGYKFNIVD